MHEPSRIRFLRPGNIAMFFAQKAEPPANHWQQIRRIVHDRRDARGPACILFVECEPALEILFRTEPFTDIISMQAAHPWELRKCRACLFCRCKAGLDFLFRCLHPQQAARPGFIGTATEIGRKIWMCEKLLRTGHGLVIAAKPVIDVHEIARIHGLFATLRHAALEQGEVALHFLLHDAARVARMQDLDVLCELVPLSLRQRQRLMHTALIAQMTAAAEHPELHDRRHAAAAIIEINVYEAAEHARDPPVARDAFEQGPHAWNRALGKEFIRIEEQHPVARRLVEREILRGRKIIAPCKRIDACAALPRDVRRRIRTACIDDDHLVGDRLHGCQPAAEIRRLVLCDDACRNPKPHA